MINAFAKFKLQKNRQNELMKERCDSFVVIIIMLRIYYENWVLCLHIAYLHELPKYCLPSDMSLEVEKCSHCHF